MRAYACRTRLLRLARGHFLASWAEKNPAMRGLWPAAHRPEFANTQTASSAATWSPGPFSPKREQGRPPSQGELKTNAQTEGGTEGGWQTFRAILVQAVHDIDHVSIRRQERVIRRFGGSGGLVVVAPRPLRAFASLCKPCVTHPRRTVRRSRLAAKTDPSLSIFFPRLTDFCCRSRMPGVGGVCKCLKIKASYGLEPAEARALVAAAVEGGNPHEAIPSSKIPKESAQVRL